MGTSTYSDICENVVWIENPPGLAEFVEAQTEDEISEGFNLHGWVFRGQESGLGRKGRLFGDHFVKGTQVVFLVNTSEYAMIGEFDYIVFSEDRTAVVEFLKDIGLPDKSIEDIDTVNQTL